MFKHTALDQIAGVVAAEAHPYPGAGRGALNAPARHLMRVGKVCASERETGPTITAVLERGPLAGRRIDVDVVEGRPPKTIDVRADDEVSSSDSRQRPAQLTQCHDRRVRERGNGTR